MNIEVTVVNYQDQQQAADLSMLLDAYAMDPMGGGKPLSAHVKANLAAELAALPQALSLIVYVDGQPAGLANCFMGYSTFKCKPLINIHDLAVLEQYRGLGLSLILMDKVEQIANDNGCCKITLEVLEGNKQARNAYIKFGFKGYELDPALGKATFWEKPL